MLVVHLKSIMSKKVKVIQLINSIADGGSETQLKNYMLNLDYSKFRCVALAETVDITSANANILFGHKVPIYTPFIPKRNLACKVLNRLQRLVIPSDKREKYSSLYIQKRILSFKPDIIHVHMKMLHYLLPIADKLQGVKIFYRCASTPERYFNYDTEIDSAEFDAAKYLLQHNGLQFIALHTQMRDALNSMFGISNTMIIHNVINLEKFKTASTNEKEQIRAQLGIPKDAFVLGHTGRCFYIKNQSFLVDVFYHVAKHNPNAYLLMIGGGDFGAVVNKINNYGLAERYLILSARKDVNVLLRAMDVFVFPSLLEGMPNALIEAQASGLKCIASSSITSEAIVSSKAIQMDLEDGAEAWADAILKDKFDWNPKSDIATFELSRIMNEVEQLYMAC